MALVYPRDMLNNFCFHVYAQKSVFIGENGYGFFFDSIITCAITVQRAGSQLKRQLHSIMVFCLGITMEQVYHNDANEQPIFYAYDNLSCLLYTSPSPRD